MYLTDDFSIQKVKKAMDKMATQDLIPAKRKNRKMRWRRKVGEKDYNHLECCTKDERDGRAEALDWM